MSEDPRDVRAELPTRHPCPLCSAEFINYNCWLCHGAGVSAEDYKKWVLCGRPKMKPEGWS